ncbi:MAG: hypothetical protein KKA05_10800 [Alphaproteobacteria bacterium]|nr:hypothetical protein [Alphaproteobacteria bacterium]
MTGENSSEMLEGLFKLLTEIRPALTPKPRLSSYETKMLRDQGVTITDFGDYALLTGPPLWPDRTLYRVAGRAGGDPRQKLVVPAAAPWG